MDGISISEQRDGLAAINNPDVSLAIWQRTLPSCLNNWLGEADTSTLPELRILVRPEDLQPALSPLLDESGLPDGPNRDILVQDIEGLVSAFASITGSDRVDVRLERIGHDACWKFHRDSVEARLVTTYLGPATEWVPLAHAERAMQEQKDYDGPLEQLNLHEVALFTGNCADPDGAIVHRSPPIEGTGRVRLLLCLNKRTIVSPPPWDEA